MEVAIILDKIIITCFIILIMASIATKGFKKEDKEDVGKFIIAKGIIGLIGLSSMFTIVVCLIILIWRL